MRLAALAMSAIIAGCTTVPRSHPAPLELAITIDDLPVHGETPPGETPLDVAQQIIAALKAEGAMAAVGFLNGQKVEADPSTGAVLNAWSAAGLPVGNHGWAHRHLSEISIAEFESEVARNEPLLARLANGSDWRWFRFPFLDEGGNDEKRSAARQVLAARGYRVAAVTMDFSDWLWTAPYARCSTKGDAEAVRRMEAMFLQAAEEGIAYSRARARQAVGRDFPYVLLLHVSAFEARMLPRLLALYRRHGFRFVPLGEAQDDPFYRLQNDPALPLTTPGPGGGVEATAIPARTDFAPILEAICH